MAHAKELQSEGICGEQIIDNDCENDSEQEPPNAPINVECPQSEDDKNAVFNSARVQHTYSIDSGEICISSPSNSSVSIRSLNSTTSKGEELPKNVGEADTIDETVEEIVEDGNEILSDIKETKSLDDESSIDTVEDENFATKAITASDEKREKMKKRLAEIEPHEAFLRKAIAKRNDRKDGDLPTEIELKKESTAHSDVGHSDVGRSEDGDDLLATVFSVDGFSPSYHATGSIPVEICTKKSKKKKSKKTSSKNSRRKDRKHKDKDASDSTGGSWWKISVKEEIYDSSDTGAGRKRTSSRSAEASYSYRSIVSKESGAADFSKPRIQKHRRSNFDEDNEGTNHSSFVSSSAMDDAITSTATRQNRKFEGSYSLRSIVEDVDCEDIKDSGRVGTNRSAMTPTATDSEVAPSAVTAAETKKDKNISGYIGMDVMIAEAVAKRQARLESKKSPKLPFQSPVTNREGLASRIQEKMSFSIPLSPSDYDDVSISISKTGTSPFRTSDENKESKNSGCGDRLSGAKCRLSGNSPKLPFQSPFANKESLSLRIQEKDFEIDILGIEEGDQKDEMSIADLAADTALKHNERIKDNDTKPKVFRLKPVALNEEQRKKDRQDHRMIFVPVADEAATYGRLVRLEEHVVEAHGGVSHHPDDEFNTWTGPKLRTDDVRPNALRAIQEAAAVGRMKCLKPEIVTNGNYEISDDHFDIENQIDEDGEKILRTHFLLDRHVKKILQKKKESMFSDSNVMGDRDDKIATYKDFDDVKLPTEILPTYDRIVGKRTGFKSFSSCADLAVIGMQMAEANQPNLDEDDDDDDDDDDVPRITLKRLRVLDSISSAVAASACKRDARLQRPGAVLRVTRKCYCPYCKDPNQFQTHKYKRLMYPALFNDTVDESNFCQEVGETIGTVSDAANADESSYTISPGGRKKKIIRIVRRTKRRPKGLEPQEPLMNSSERKRVIDETSLTPEELGSLKKQFQTEVINGMTSEEFVLVANTLRGKAPTTVDPTDLDLNQAKDTVNELSTNATMNESNLMQLGEREGNLLLPATLPFVDIAGDCLSIPTESVEKITPDSNSTKCPTPETSGQRQRECILQNQEFKPSKNDRIKTPVSPKSPSMLKSKKVINAQPVLTASKRGAQEANESDTKYLSPQGQGKRKVRHRTEETIESPIQTQILNLPAPPSKTELTKPKKTLRSRLRNLTLNRSSSPTRKDTLSVSEHGSRHKKTKKSFLGLRGRRRSHSRSKSNGGRRSHSLEARHKALPMSDVGTLGGKDVLVTTKSADGDLLKDSIESQKRKTTKHHNLTSISNSGSQSQVLHTGKMQEQKSNWAPERRAPSRTQSLPIVQKPKSAPDLSQKIDKPQTTRSLPVKKPNTVTRISSLENEPTRVAPSRTKSFEGPLQFANNNIDDPKIRRLSPTAGKEQKKTSTKQFVESTNGSPKQRFQSPRSQKRGLSTRLAKMQNYPKPELPPPKRNSTATTPIPPIPSIITISFDSDDYIDPNSNSSGRTSSETPESSESSYPLQKRRVLPKKPRKSMSLDGHKPKRMESRSLDGQRINEVNTKGRSKARKVKKQEIAVPDKLRRDPSGKSFRPDRSTSHHVPQPLPKRSRSLDRFAITKLGARGKKDRTDRSIERRKDKSRERKNDKSRERKDRSLERRRKKSQERKNDKSRERKKDKSRERTDRSLERRRKKSRERKKDKSSERKTNSKQKRWLKGQTRTQTLD